jgi:HAD superfamily hydrolase (TIGR01490 family)
MDKTLIRKDSAALYIRHEFSSGKASPWRVLQVGAWGLCHSLGLLPTEAAARRALSWYRGRDVDELRVDTQAWAERTLFQHIGSEARAAVEHHRAAGDLLVLVTAQSQIAARPVMDELRMDHMISSVVEISEGKLTGRFVGELCYAEGKLHRVREFLRERTPSADLSRATAYGDSISDAPLLSAVGEPVAVNPDVRLRQLARSRGWRIERW